VSASVDSERLRIGDSRSMNDRSACPSMRVGRFPVKLGCAAALLAVSCQRDEPRPAAVSNSDQAPASDPIAARRTEPRAVAPSPAASSPSVYEPCVELCSRSRELKCSNAARCPEMCREMTEGVACAEQLLGAMRCFAAQPIARWACGDDGLAAVKDGNCDREQSRYVECVGRAAGQ
jgi:hypothetical protein